jgi:hypothetical protein
VDRRTGLGVLETRLVGVSRLVLVRLAGRLELLVGRLAGRLGPDVERLGRDVERLDRRDGREQKQLSVMNGESGVEWSQECQVVFEQALRSGRFACRPKKGGHELIEPAIQHGCSVACFIVSAMVFDHLVGMQDVGTDLVAPSSIHVHALERGHLRFVLLLL